jgi:LPPG:FO 2-phospho-L-lactate transferase
MSFRSIVALAGGVGGARMAAGLAAAVPDAQLTVIVNTADDFEHLGLSICPDIDTDLYTLAGLGDPERGWGLAGESWAFMDALGALGGEQWFLVGDRDLATHVLRSQWLRQGLTLSTVTDKLRQALDVSTTVLPMSDQPVRSIIATPEGELGFQDYFVRQRCEPPFLGIRFEGAEKATVGPGVLDAIASADLIVFCPSNPWLSIAPILAVSGIERAIKDRKAPAVAVSPFIGGKAIKGPAAKIMGELGLACTPAAVAEHFGDSIDGLVIDSQDGPDHGCGCAVMITDTLMEGASGRRRLAGDVVAFGDRLLVSGRA